MSEMANLIKNGDFSQQGAHWSASEADKVHYENGDCVIASPAFISQEVPTPNGDGGTFMLSARMKTNPGAAGRITVQAHPTGEPVSLDVGGGQSWEVLSKKFKANNATIKFVVKLEANDGENGKPGSYFGDVTLSKLS
jgi:hypothetical protein